MVARGPLKCRGVSGLLGSFTVPDVVTSLINSVCGVISRVFVNRKINCLKGTTAGITCPFSAVYLTVTLLIKVNDTSHISLYLKHGRPGTTTGTTKGNVILVKVFKVVCLLINRTFLSLLLGTFKTAPSMFPCTGRCTDVALVKVPFLVMAGNVDGLVQTSKGPGCSVIYVIVKTVVGAVLSPVFVFTYS